MYKPSPGVVSPLSRNSPRPLVQRPNSSLAFNPFRGFDELKELQTPRNSNGRKSCMELRPDRREELIVKSSKREHKKVIEKKAKVEQSELERLSFMLQQQRQRNMKLERNMEELKKDFTEIKQQAAIASIRPPSDSRLSFKSVSDLSQQIPSPNNRDKGDFSRTLQTGRFGGQRKHSPQFSAVEQEQPFGVSPVKASQTSGMSFQSPALQDTSFGIQDYQILQNQHHHNHEGSQTTGQRTFGRIESQGSLQNETEYDYLQCGDSFAILSSDKTFMSEMPIESSECLSQRQNEFRVEIKKGKKIINKPPLRNKISQNKFKSNEKPIKIAAKCSQMIKQQALAQAKRKNKLSQNSFSSAKVPLSSSKSISSQVKISSPNKPVAMKAPGASGSKYSSNSLKQSSTIKPLKRSMKSISTSYSKPNITITPASAKPKLMPESCSSRTLRIESQSFIVPPIDMSLASQRQTDVMSTDSTFSPTSVKQRENKNLMNVPPTHHRKVWSGTRSMGSLLKHKHKFQFTGKVPKANMSRIRELAQCQEQRGPEYFYAHEPVKPKNVEELKERLKEMQPHDQQYILKKKYAFPMVVETPDKRRQSQSYLVPDGENVKIIEEEIEKVQKKFKKYGSAKKSSGSLVPSLQSSMSSVVLAEQLKEARIEDERIQNQLKDVWNSKQSMIPDGEEQKTKQFQQLSVRKEERSSRVIKKIKSEVQKKIKNIYTD